MMDPLSQSIVLFKILLGGIAGGIIGYEREHAGKPLGFRTTMLVGIATVTLVSLGPAMVEFFALDSEILRADPLRIIEAIVVGVSFIGAGTIIHQKQEGIVKNLTTAATILVVAGIGATIALGLYYIAAGATALVLLVNHALRKGR